MKLNLSLIKFDAFMILSKLAPFGIGCWFGKTIYIDNQNLSRNKIQFDLNSHEFSRYENRYILIDSTFRNDEEVQINTEKLRKFTFGSLVLDSLMPGSYKIYGSAISYPGGREHKEQFSHEFKIE